MEGIIKKTEPYIKDGVHNTYSSNYGTFYSFFITIEYDGKEERGSTSGKNETLPYGPGDKVEFERHVSGDYVNFKKVKKPKDGGGYSSAPKKDWAVIEKQKIMDICIKTSSSLATKLLSFFEQESVKLDDVIKLAIKFREWTLEGDDHKAWNLRNSALSRAVECFDIVNLDAYFGDHKLTDKVFNVAEAWISQYKWD